MRRANRFSIIIWWAVVLGFVVLLSACAQFPTKKAFTVPVTYDVSVARATRLAAQAMQEIDFLVTQQTEAAGYVRGMMIKSVYFGLEKVTYYMDVQINKQAGGGLGLDVTCTAGREVAISDEPPKFVKQFHEAFDRLVKAEVARKAPSPQPAVSPTPEAPIEQVPVKKGKEYEL